MAYALLSSLCAEILVLPLHLPVEELSFGIYTERRLEILASQIQIRNGLEKTSLYYWQSKEKEITCGLQRLCQSLHTFFTGYGWTEMGRPSAGLSYDSCRSYMFWYLCKSSDLMWNPAVFSFLVSGDWLSKVGWSLFVGFGLRKRLFLHRIAFLCNSVKNMKVL